MYGINCRMVGEGGKSRWDEFWTNGQFAPTYISLTISCLIPQFWYSVLFFIEMRRLDLAMNEVTKKIHPALLFA